MYKSILIVLALSLTLVAQAEKGKQEAPALDVIIDITPDNFVSVAVVSDYKSINEQDDKCNSWHRRVEMEPFKSETGASVTVKVAKSNEPQLVGECIYKRDSIKVLLLLPHDPFSMGVAGMWIGQSLVVSSSEDRPEPQVLNYQIQKYGWHPAMAACDNCKIEVGPSGVASVKINGDLKSIEAYQAYLKKFEKK